MRGAVSARAQSHEGTPTSEPPPQPYSVQALQASACAACANSSAQFRRSMKGEKETHRPHHISIPPKDAIAIVPPKKVRISLHLQLHV